MYRTPQVVLFITQRKEKCPRGTLIIVPYDQNTPVRHLHPSKFSLIERSVIGPETNMERTSLLLSRKKKERDNFF